MLCKKQTPKQMILASNKRTGYRVANSSWSCGVCSRIFARSSPSYLCGSHCKFAGMCEGCAAALFPQARKSKRLVLQCANTGNSMPLPIPRCDACTHEMVASSTAEGKYQDGYTCSRCEGLFSGDRMRRWQCTACNNDVCFNCWPKHKSSGSTTCISVADPVCLRCGGNELRYMTAPTDNYYDCSMCYGMLSVGGDMWMCWRCEWGVC